MPARYEDISRAAYTMNRDADPWLASYRALAYPEAWDPAVLALCNLGRDPDAEPYRTAPTSRLDATLQALAPELTVRTRVRDAAAQAADAWLYAPLNGPAPLPGDTVHRLATAWLHDLRPEPEHRRALLDTLEQLRSHQPQWREAQVDLLGCQPTDGNTAAPAPRQYQLATDALARRILALDAYDYGAGSLHFRAVPRGPRQQGAELVSHPLSHEVKGKTWWFSIYIAVTLHTVAFDPTPRLHVHTGVRRWATRPNPKTGQVYLPYKGATSVYLTPTIPWLPGAPASDRFAIASLVRDRETGDYQWGGNSAGRILRRLSLSQPFPDPQKLLAQPADWIDARSGTRAAIVHSTRMGAHGIGAGLMSHQRSQITEWIEQALPDGMRRVPHLSLTSLGTSVPANPRPNPTGPVAKLVEETRAGHARRQALAAAATLSTSAPDAQPAPAGPAEICARLLWQSALLRDKAITAFAETLGLEVEAVKPTTEADYDAAAPGAPVVHTWQTPELTIHLRCLRLAGGLAEGLGIDPRARPKHKVLSDAVAARRTATRRLLAADGADPAHPELALVEIDHRRDFAHRLDDPKFALRLGAADAGVLTQFALVPKKGRNGNTITNVGHRVRSAWHDGLRQLGVRVMPQHTLGGTLPEGLRYAAVWMVKRRATGPTRLPRHTPVAVMATPIPDQPGMAAITGWDPDHQSWIPYPAFLLRLVKIAEIPDVAEDDDPGAPPKRATYRAWRRNLDEQRRDTESFLQKMIYSLRGRPTALLTHAQNSRMHWPWLQDGQAEPDLIRLGHAPAAYLDPDLRLIRLRDGDGRETPQWWGNAPEGGVNGLPTGLWCDTDQDGAPAGRIFYSTTPKASTFRDSAVEANKLATRPLRQGKNKGEPTIDTHIPAWNPDLVEIAVLGCHEDDGDKPEAYALTVHQMRQAPDYLDALALPLPLHLAGLAQEYVLPTVAEEDETATPEPVADADESDASSAPDPLVDALGLIPQQRRPSEDRDVDVSDAPGLAQAPEESDYL